MNIKTVKGTYDILPEKTEEWQAFETIVRDVCKVFNYDELRTPIFEKTELFIRSVGETSDVVTKEMYSVIGRENKKGVTESLTLRPEGTAGLARSVVEHKLYAKNAINKLFYVGPMFRYERPQAGRQRQFHQFGVETLGSFAPETDFEVISLGLEILNRIGINKYKVLINTLGDDQARINFSKALQDHFKPVISEFCEDCQNRINTNPLRILDCKKDSDHERMRSVPEMITFLSEESKSYFDRVCSLLKANKIDFLIDAKLVRGLDYYTETVFEVVSTDENFGAQSTLFGGGRYNKLISDLGGPEVPGIGFGMGIERIMIGLDLLGVSIASKRSLDCYFINLSNTQAVHEYISTLVLACRKANISCDFDLLGKSTKAQFKVVDRINPKFIVMIGEDELHSKSVVIKDQLTKNNVTVKLSEFIKHLEGGL